MAESEDLRVKAQQYVQDLSVHSVELCFTLARIKADSPYLGWSRPDGTVFESFSRWATHDLGAFMSRSYADQLAQAGITFYRHRDRILDAAHRGRFGVRRLLQAHLDVQNGLALDTAAAHLVDGAALPEEWQTKRDADGDHADADGEQYIRLNDVAVCKRGEERTVRLGLTLAAIRGGQATHSAAFVEWAVGEAQNMTLPPSWLTLPEENVKILFALIEAGKFYCRRCGKIPVKPSLHHVILRSLGGDRGPVELLCVECHNRVQPKWREYANSWYGRDVIDKMLKEFRSDTENAA